MVWGILGTVGLVATWMALRSETYGLIGWTWAVIVSLAGEGWGEGGAYRHKLAHLIIRVDHRGEAVEQVVAVLRTGRGLGMVLDAEHRAVDQANSFEGAVEQRDVALLDPRR